MWVFTSSAIIVITVVPCCIRAVLAGIIIFPIILLERSRQKRLVLTRLPFVIIAIGSWLLLLPMWVIIVLTILLGMSVVVLVV